MNCSPPRGLVGSLGIALVLLLVLPSCSDDPILGPTDDSSDDGGGSYSSIKRLAPPSTRVDSSSPSPTSPPHGSNANPERF